MRNQMETFPEYENMWASSIFIVCYAIHWYAEFMNVTTNLIAFIIIFTNMH